MMRLKVTYPGNGNNFELIDEDTGESVGLLRPFRIQANGAPTVESMTRFQNAKVVLDGKSLKRLQRSSA